MYTASIKSYMENFAIQTSEEQYEKFIKDVEAVNRVNETPGASSRSNSVYQNDESAQTGGQNANYPFRDQQ